MDRDKKNRIAIFLSTSGHSGVDRAMQHLIPELARRGYSVDLLKVRKHGPNIDPVPAGVRVIDLGVSSTYPALGAVTRYLRRERPAVLLADKDRVNRTALLARWLSGAPTRLVLSFGTTVSIELEKRGRFDRLLQKFSMGKLYPFADLVIVTSQGVADDMSEYTGLARDHIAVVESPVIPDALLNKQLPKPDHPWFAAGEPPVILGVGELSYRKDFATVIRAFARLRQSRPCRLIILGKGRHQENLEKLAKSLGVQDDLALPGFVAEPYAWMAHAAVFAFASRWEGLGFVLIEALAVGTPVVSTDCPSGPAEILQQGRFGSLIPIGDDEAMAHELEKQLDDPLPAELLRKAALPYTVSAATTAYLRAFQLPSDHSEPEEKPINDK